MKMRGKKFQTKKDAFQSTLQISQTAFHSGKKKMFAVQNFNPALIYNALLLRLMHQASKISNKSLWIALINTKTQKLEADLQAMLTGLCIKQFLFHHLSERNKLGFVNRWIYTGPEAPRAVM